VVDVKPVRGRPGFGRVVLSFPSSSRPEGPTEQIEVVTSELRELQRGCIILVSGGLEIGMEPTIYADAAVLIRLDRWRVKNSASGRPKFRTGHWRELGDRKVFVSAHGRATTGKAGSPASSFRRGGFRASR
jgi:hypothetical protein